MSKKQAVFNAAREASVVLATYFDQFDRLNVSADVAADDANCDVLVLNSTVTSHGARVYVHYVTRYVEIEFVNRYSNEPTRMTRQHVRSTVELEQYLRRNKVLVETRLRKLDEATDDQLLIAAKGEGFDEMGNRAGRAYWNGENNGGRLSPADRTAIILQLKEMGFKSMDVTNPNWIEPSKNDVPTKVMATEAQWLNSMKRGGC